MWQGSWIYLCTLTSSFCSMSRLAGWFLLRKRTKHTSLLYLCIFQKRIRKIQKNICGVVYFVKVVGLHTTAYIMRNTTKVIYQKYDEGVIYSTKISKSTAILKKNLRFKQLRLNYINSQKKQTEKERLRLVISSIRVGVVAKTDDEVYVSSILCQSRPSC